MYNKPINNLYAFMNLSDFMRVLRVFNWPNFKKQSKE